MTDDVKDGEKDKGGASPNYLGDWKTKEEAEKGHQELKGFNDRQGNEIGTLRKQVTELTDTLTKLMQTQGQKPNEDKGNPAETELGKIFDDLGTIDLVEEGAAKKVAGLFMKAMKVTQQITKDETLKLAGNQFKDTLTKRDAESLRNDWLKNNPKFTELQKNGAFQALKSKNPLHDDFSAYYDATAQELSAKVSALQAALDEAKKVANLAGKDTKTGKVFTKPGGTVRTSQDKPKTPQERRQSAIDAVIAAQGGQ